MPACQRQNDARLCESSSFKHRNGWALAASVYACCCCSSEVCAGHGRGVWIGPEWQVHLECGDAQVLDCAGKHQVLIFVHSRKETAKTARYLKEEALREDKLASFMRVSACPGPLLAPALVCFR